MDWEVGRGSFKNRPQSEWGQALKVDQKAGAGNLRSGLENERLGFCRGPDIVCVFVGGKVSNNSCKNNTKK